MKRKKVDKVQVVTGGGGEEGWADSCELTRFGVCVKLRPPCEGATGSGPVGWPSYRRCGLEVSGSDLSRLPAILTESFRTLPTQSLEPNTEIVPKVDHDHFIPHRLQLIIQ